MMKISLLQEAKALDFENKLKAYRDEFYLNDGQIYFDGNSLGLMSKRAEMALDYLTDSWKRYAIDGWTKGAYPWFTLSEKLAELSAPLIGAKKEEVIVTGSTTSNLHQLLATFFKPTEKRNKILADNLNFPTDIYAIKSKLEQHGLDPNSHLIQVESRDGHTIEEIDVIAAMREDVSIIILPSVLYRSGQILNMQQLTQEAHKRGILIGFDLCHSIGAIPHDLSKWGVDFAFWCTYKHLNGGPGSVAGLYVNERHFGTAPGLAGWFGSDKNRQFDMSHTMTQAMTAGAYQMGTPHILSAAPLFGSLEIFHEVGIDAIRKRSLELTNFLMKLVEIELDGYGFTISNPREDHRRGAHVYLEHTEAARICKALKKVNVIPDFRTPRGIRLAPVALYNTAEEVYDMVQRLKNIMEHETYKEFSNAREIVS